MENKLLSFQVDEGLVKPIVEKQIQSAIVAALGNKDDLLDAIIKQALAQKVNQEGRVSQYNSDNKFNFVDITINKAVREAVSEAVKEWAAENKEKVRKVVEKELNKNETYKKITESFIDALTKSLSSSWSTRCEIRFEERER